MKFTVSVSFVIFIFVASVTHSFAEERSICIDSENLLSTKFTSIEAYSAIRETIIGRGHNVANSCENADILIIIGGSGATVANSYTKKQLIYVYIVIVEFSSDTVVHNHAMRTSPEQQRQFITDTVGYMLDKFF